jgi:hypothetical protein
MIALEIKRSHVWMDEGHMRSAWVYGYSGVADVDCRAIHLVCCQCHTDAIRVKEVIFVGGLGFQEVAKENMKELTSGNSLSCCDRNSASIVVSCNL